MKKSIAILICIIFLFSTIASAQTINYNYDSNGNLVKNELKKYEYNALNQLKKITDLNNTIIEEYTYDHEGNRIRKIEYKNGIAIQNTYYLSKNLIRTINTTGTYDTYYYYDENQNLLAEKKANNPQTTYYHTDHLGSTTLTTNKQGNLIEETTYKPFGQTQGNNRFLYTGKEKDKTNIYYYGARYYNPETTKFTQPDTITPNIYDPQTLNRYAYARNNPYKYTDPSGHNPILVIGTILFGLIATTTPYWAPYINAYFTHSTVQDISTAIKNPSPTNLGFAALGIYDATTPGIPEGKITKKIANEFEEQFLKKGSKTLKETGEITVKNYKEANTLLKNNWPNAIKIPGTSTRKSITKANEKVLLNKGDTLYHKDFEIDGNLVKGHYPNSEHGKLPHINIFNKEKEYVIYIDTNLAK